MKVRVSRRILDHLSGSGAWQHAQWGRTTPEQADGESQVALDVMVALQKATRRKDGSITVVLSEEQAGVLFDYVDTMAAGARDNAGWDMDALHDLNAATALLRHLH